MTDPSSSNPAPRILGHGVDLVATDRIAEMTKRHADHFLDRCFTPDEVAYADANAKRRAEHLAARFAAKEAVLKALGTGWRHGIAWTDIEVLRDDLGKPLVRLTGRAAEIAAQRGIRHWHLSLSHTDTHALASVIAEG